MVRQPLHPVETDSGRESPLHAEDLQLVRRAQRGDEDAVAEFVRRMHCVPAFLQSRSRRLGGLLPREDLADLSQDVLVVIWKKLDAYHGLGPLESWAFRVSSLELMNALRSRRRRSGAQGAVIQHLGQEPATVEDGHDYEQVLQGLQALGPPGADVIELKHLEELSFPEIAARLRLSINTVKSQYYRGMSRLRQLLGCAESEA